jgi:hypothetical protein
MNMMIKLNDWALMIFAVDVILTETIYITCSNGSAHQSVYNNNCYIRKKIAASFPSFIKRDGIIMLCLSIPVFSHRQLGSKFTSFHKTWYDHAITGYYICTINNTKLSELTTNYLQSHK